MLGLFNIHHAEVISHDTDMQIYSTKLTDVFKSMGHGTLSLIIQEWLA